MGCGGEKEGGIANDIHISGLSDELAVDHGEARSSICDSKVIFFEGIWEEG